MSTKNYKVTYGATQRVETDDSAAQRQAEQIFNASLCANCRHQSDCGFLSKACAPILECELHECGLSDRPRLMVVKKGANPLAPQSEESDALIGLCMNCENLNSCSLPKALGGVWMCEEYR
jgi:hypothetical protein